MSLLESTTGVGGLLPESWGQLITQPLREQSVAYRAGNVVSINDYKVHFPVLTDDVASGWYAEAATIDAEDATFAEVECVPSKVAALSVVSNEMAFDSSPAAANVLGASMAASVAKQVDKAFFSASVTNGPSGLGSLTVTTLGDSTTPLSNLDNFSQAIETIHQAGGNATAILAHPDDAVALRTLKDETGSNRPILGTDVSNGPSQTVFGLPVLVSAQATSGSLYVVDGNRIMVVERQGATLAASQDEKFSSDQTVLRAVMRVGFSFVHAGSIVKVINGAAN